MTRLEFTGQETFPGSPALIAALLGDPLALARCIPGINHAEAVSDQEARLLARLDWQRLRGEVPFSLRAAQQGSEHLILLGGAALGHQAELQLTVTLGESNGQTTAAGWQASGEVNGPLTLLGGSAIKREAERVMGRTIANLRRELERRASQLA